MGSAERIERLMCKDPLLAHGLRLNYRIGRWMIEHQMPTFGRWASSIAWKEHLIDACLKTPAGIVALTKALSRGSR